MTLSRNFRTTYYKTLGVPVVQHIVDVDASFAALLGDRTAGPDVASVNVAQLAKLSLEVGVAPGYRSLTWQLLTGALPALPAAWAFARDQRKEMLDDLLAAEEALRPVHRRNQQSEEEEVEMEEEARRVVELHRFYWTQVLNRDASELWGSKAAGAVARAVCDVVEGDAERFWCFSRALELLADGAELLDPPLRPAAVYGMATAEVEGVLLRVLDVKRRRAVETASGPHRERL